MTEKETDRDDKKTERVLFLWDRLSRGGSVSRQEMDSFRFLIIPICFFLCHNYSLPLLSSMEALMNAWPALILIKAGSMDESVLPYVYIYL